MSLSDAFNFDRLKNSIKDVPMYGSRIKDAISNKIGNHINSLSIWIFVITIIILVLFIICDIFMDNISKYEYYTL